MGGRIRQSLFSQAVAHPTQAPGLSPPARRVFRRLWLTILVVSVSLSAAIGGWYITRSATIARANDRFDCEVQSAASAIFERLRDCEVLLRGGAGLFAVVDEVNRSTWHQYVANLHIGDHRGFQGIGFSRWLPAAEKEAHVLAVRGEGFADYAIHPAGDRPEYSAIVFMEPSEKLNRRALGYDMLTEPVRHAAMVRARDTGLVALSGKVDLIGEKSNAARTGFLLYLAVFRRNAPQETVEQRREALTGFVSIPFVIDDFIRGVLDEADAPELEIYDGDQPRGEALMYRKPGSEDQGGGRRHFAVRETTLEYAGHRWLLVFKSSRVFEERIAFGTALSLLTLGIASCLLLWGLLVMLRRSQGQAELLSRLSSNLQHSNAELAAEIGERRRVEEEVRASLAEKEVLLKEVHHRVKSNLAAISALVDMQAKNAAGEDSRKALAELSGRIRSMALVHEQLYRSRDLTGIAMQDYIEALTDFLNAAYAEGRDIRVTVRAEGVRMGLDSAVPCGLLITELVSNACKYAFPEGRSHSGSSHCEILVTVGWDGNAYRLAVADNGMGLPAGIDWSNSETMGLHLVRLLGEHQLQGRLELDCRQGTTLRLRFSPQGQKTI